MIGKKLRRKRRELGLSLRDLGAKTELTASFLSLVERGDSSPSLASLHRIAKALEVPVFYFYDDYQRASPIIRAENRREIIFPNSRIGYELLTPDVSRQMMFILIRLEPNAKRICEPLARTTEQWIYVLEGELKLIVSGEVHLLEPGDCIYFDGDSLSEFTTAKKEEVVFINGITPPAL